jgi:separase
MVGLVRSLAMLGEADPKDAGALASALAAVQEHLRALRGGNANDDAAAFAGGVARAATGHLAAALAARSPHLPALVSTAADALTMLEALDAQEDEEERAATAKAARGRQQAAPPPPRAKQQQQQQQPREVDLLQYALIRRLVGCKRLEDALEQGWRLLDRLTAALGPEAGDGGSAAPASGGPLADLFTGAVLSLVVCAAEVKGGERALDSSSALALQRAVARLLSMLGGGGGGASSSAGAQQDAASKKHGETLFKYLSKMLAQGSSGAASSSSVEPLTLTARNLLEAAALAGVAPAQALQSAAGALVAGGGGGGGGALLAVALTTTSRPDHLLPALEALRKRARGQPAAARLWAGEAAQLLRSPLQQQHQDQDQAALAIAAAGLAISSGAYDGDVDEGEDEELLRECLERAFLAGGADATSGPVAPLHLLARAVLDCAAPAQSSSPSACASPLFGSSVRLLARAAPALAALSGAKQDAAAAAALAAAAAASARGWAVMLRANSNGGDDDEEDALAIREALAHATACRLAAPADLSCLSSAAHAAGADASSAGRHAAARALLGASLDAALRASQGEEDQATALDPPIRRSRALMSALWREQQERQQQQQQQTRPAGKGKGRRRAGAAGERELLSASAAARLSAQAAAAVILASSADAAVALAQARPLLKQHARLWWWAVATAEEEDEDDDGREALSPLSVTEAVAAATAATATGCLPLDALAAAELPLLARCSAVAGEEEQVEQQGSAARRGAILSAEARRVLDAVAERVGAPLASLARALAIGASGGLMGTPEEELDALEAAAVGLDPLVVVAGSGGRRAAKTTTATAADNHEAAGLAHALLATRLAAAHALSAATAAESAARGEAAADRSASERGPAAVPAPAPAAAAVDAAAAATAVAMRRPRRHLARAVELWVQAEPVGGPYSAACAEAAADGWHLAALCGWQPASLERALLRCRRAEEGAGDGGALQLLLLPPVGEEGAADETWQWLPRLLFPASFFAGEEDEEEARVHDDDTGAAPSSSSCSSLVCALALAARSDAALRRGGTPAASVLAGDALRAAAAAASSANGGNGRPLASLAAHCAAVWRAARAHEAAGAPDETLRFLRELARLAQSAGSAPLAALAHAAQAAALGRAGAGSGRARRHAVAAAAWLQAWEEDEEEEDGRGAKTASSLPLLELVRAWVGLAEAEAAVAEGDGPTAARLAREAAARLWERVEEATACQKQQHPAPRRGGRPASATRPPPPSLLWPAGEVGAALRGCQARGCLMAGLADPVSASASAVPAALAALRQGEEELSSAAAAAATAPAPASAAALRAWPHACAALRVEIAALTQPESARWRASSDAADRGPVGGGELLVVGGLSGSRRDNNKGVGGRGGGSGGDCVGGGDGSGLASQFARTLDLGGADDDDGNVAAPAAKARGRKPPAGRAATKSSRSSKGGGARSSAADDDADDDAWVCGLAAAAEAAAHAPLVLRRVAALLAEASAARGSARAAALFVHLSLGASAREQALALAAAKAARVAARGEGSGGGGGGDNDDLWRQASAALSLDPRLLRDLASAPDADAVVARASAAARSWLSALLAPLPPGTAVSCCCAAPGGGAGLLICRVVAPGTRSAAATDGDFGPAEPLVALVVPGCVPGEEKEEEDDDPAASAASSLAARLEALLSDSAASMAAGAEVLAMDADLEAASGSATASSSSSGATKAAKEKGAAGAASGSGGDAKARWWRARLALDKRLAALQRDMSARWLGAWRCLLGASLGSYGQEFAAAARAAAGRFLEEHFELDEEEEGEEDESGDESDNEEARQRRRLRALVALLLADLACARRGPSPADPPPCCPAPEDLRAAAARSLCRATQHRLDAPHLQRLAEALGDVAAALGSGGAAGAGSVVAATSAPCFFSPCVAATANASACATPAPRKASRLQSMAATPAAPAAATPGPPTATAAAATARRSRLGAMQAAATPAPPPARRRAVAFAVASDDSDDGQAADYGAADAAATMLKGLSLAEGGGGKARGRGGSKGKSARVVRFAAAAEDEEDDEPDENDPAARARVAPPPSIARHAVGRSDDAAAAAAVAGGGAAVGDGGPAALGGLAAATPGPALSGGDAPALLILDGVLQSLPWESCPALAGGRAQHSRVPCLPLAAAAALRAGAGRASSSSAPPTLRLRRAFFLLNPDGDLASTQATFEGWMRGGGGKGAAPSSSSSRSAPDRLLPPLAPGQPPLGLPGTAGARPDPRDLARDLRGRELYLYFGHGAGEQYVPLAALRRLDRCAGALLMGCSSGRLHCGGLAAGVGGATSSATMTALPAPLAPWYEPGGPVLGYLLGGSPAAAACLWDVTDRDIDRFAAAALARWAAAGGGGGGGGDGDDGSDAPPPVLFGAALEGARAACRLPHLIGAAPVVYGVPTRVALA